MRVMKLFIELLWYGVPSCFFVVPSAISDVALAFLVFRLRCSMVQGTCLLDSSDGKQEKHQSQLWGGNDRSHYCYRGPAAVRRRDVTCNHIRKVY
jgi:hypothetical protein